MSLSTAPILFDRFFTNPAAGVPARYTAARPAVDQVVYEDRVELVADLPGLSREDIDLQYGDGRLTIRAERALEAPEDGQVVRRERLAQGFSRSFVLGEDVDVENIQASMKDGVLRITLPKSERARPRQIEVTVN